VARKKRSADYNGSLALAALERATIIKVKVAGHLYSASSEMLHF